MFRRANFFIDPPLVFLITTIVAIAFLVVILEISETQEVD